MERSEIGQIVRESVRHSEREKEEAKNQPIGFALAEENPHVKSLQQGVESEGKGRFELD